MQINNFSPLLQKDYGEPQDCSLVSIVASVKYLNQALNVQDIYNEVEKIAKSYFYRGHLGTFPLFINDIYKHTLKKFNINKKVKTRYIKGIGFNFTTIKCLIDNNIPVILSLWNDGVDKYKNHSVVIVGYDENNNFLIYDNWSLSINKVNYKKLSFISSICWTE